MKIIETHLQHPYDFDRRKSTTMVVLHHAEASRASVEDINRWHLARNFNGIGYHYYIRKDGSIYRGRPEWSIGAHALGANEYSIGICCEGAYMTEIMPVVQLSALKALLRDIMARNGKLSLVRHKDVYSTDCPGNRFPWAEVQEYEKEDDSMNYEDFKAYMKRYEAEREKDPNVPKSAKEAWPAAKDAGIMDGTMPNAPATRAQLAVVLHRLDLIGK